ncbi:uncharacterized protein LOC133898768 [Phragmites australis]|uniref:uncharacterized protein LOC133898768 n=1 Tax=Phragmites australis TaxID=29695 RepID=UPI002D7A2FB7|nr:uncharacterized protein LOC133898768 [Phragmites australis]
MASRRNPQFLPNAASGCQVRDTFARIGDGAWISGGRKEAAYTVARFVAAVIDRRQTGGRRISDKIKRQPIWAWSSIRTAAEHNFSNPFPKERQGERSRSHHHVLPPTKARKHHHALFVGRPAVRKVGASLELLEQRREEAYIDASKIYIIFPSDFIVVFLVIIARLTID